MATISPPVLIQQTAIPDDFVFLRELEVVTLLKQILKTQEAILFLLEDVTCHRRSFATERTRGA